MQQAVAPHLEPGESIQAIFGAQTKSQYFALISYWILMFNKAWRVVVATDRRIVVFQTGRWGMTRIEGVTAQSRRQTRIGPAKGLGTALTASASACTSTSGSTRTSPSPTRWQTTPIGDR